MAKHQYIVVSQSETMNRGDNTGKPNHYVGIIRYNVVGVAASGADIVDYFDNVKLLAHVGCQDGSLSFAMCLVEQANENKLTPAQVQQECWKFISNQVSSIKPKPAKTPPAAPIKEDPDQLDMWNEPSGYRPYKKPEVAKDDASSVTKSVNDALREEMK